jgi:ApaG protein
VQSQFLADQSSPRDGQYLFAYHIRISNEGPGRAQLVSRKWIINDADGHVEHVHGPGVVGEQPTLHPGKSFEYSSFCPLRTNFGSMQGTYTMRTKAGETFQAAIAPFTLAMPGVVN